MSAERFSGQPLGLATVPMPHDLAGAGAVTVEVFARWVHDSLSPVVAAAGGEALAVRVWETPIAFGGYHARLGG